MKTNSLLVIKDSSASDTFIVTGPQKTLVVLVEFQDILHNATYEDIYAIVFEGMNEYYKWVSYNLTWITGKVIEKWYQLPAPMKEYVWDGKTKPWTFFKPFIQHVIELVDPDLDFREYSKLIIVHAGTNRDLSGSFGFYGLGIPVDGTFVNDVAINAEFDDMGFFVHEFGHSLRLPDLYALPDFNPKYVGRWDVMSQALGQGMLAWSKIRLGWISQVQIYQVASDEVANIIVEPLETKTSGFYAVRIDLSDGTYYLVENRQKIGFDETLPDSGLLIMQINESKIADWGAGPIVLIDAHNETPTLDDATFDIGVSENPVFIDNYNNLSVIILKMIDSSYSILVANVTQGNQALDASITINEAEVWIQEGAKRGFLMFRPRLEFPSELLIEAKVRYVQGRFEEAKNLATQSLAETSRAIVGFQRGLFMLIFLVVVLALIFIIIVYERRRVSKVHARAYTS